jgi:hypothetical protein
MAANLTTKGKVTILARSEFHHMHSISDQAWCLKSPFTVVLRVQIFLALG